MKQEYNEMTDRHLTSSVEEETEYDELLQRLLSVLAELPDLPVNDLHRWNLVDAVDEEFDNDSRFAATTTFLNDMTDVLKGDSFSLISSQCSSSSKANLESLSPLSFTTSLLLCWEASLVLLGKIMQRISASALFVTASTSFYFSNPSKVDGVCNFFPIICILMCCRALQNLVDCQIHASRSVPLAKFPSWKRAQSLLFETLRLYDQFQKCCELPLSSSLWCNHVLPVTSTFHRFLWQRCSFAENQYHRWRWYMAYEAIAVAYTSHLVVQQQLWNHRNTESVRSWSQLSVRSLTSVSTSLDQHVLSGQYDWLCDHAWRNFDAVHKHSKHDLITSYKEAVQSEIGPTFSQALTYFTIDFGPDEAVERRDLLCGLSSAWLDLGIALLVSLVWNNRPNVWTSVYQWRLFFPHVKVLLLAGVTQDEEIDPAELLRRRASIAPHGYHLLEDILTQTTTRSLCITSGLRLPDDPVHTCQLLVNCMVEASRSSSQQAQRLPNSIKIYQKLKMLVGKYRPIDQVEMVERLIQSCPYPGVKPKLADLLRSMVEWNDTDAESKVWHSIVEQHFLLPIEAQLSDWSKDVTSTSIICTLLNDTEQFAAYLGLLHIWIICKRKLPAELHKAKNRITEIHAKLRSLLGHRSSSPRPTAASNDSLSSSVELHRLELLENSLQRTVEVMEGLDYL